MILFAEILPTNALDTDFFGKLVATLIVILGAAGGAKFLFFRKPPLEVQLANLAHGISTVTHKLKEFDGEIGKVNHRLSEGDKIMNELNAQSRESIVWREHFTRQLVDIKENTNIQFHEVKTQNSMILAKMTKRKDRDS